MKKIVEPIKPFYCGKVRNLYAINDSSMLMLNTDKISAFDQNFIEEVPHKGIVLNQISTQWFRFIKNTELPRKHNFELAFVSELSQDFPSEYKNWEYARFRSCIVKKTTRIDFECIVRGYAAGSLLKQEKFQNMKWGEKLAEPIFELTTKAPIGEKDELVSYDFFEKSIGKKLAKKIKEISLAIYEFIAEKYKQKGIIMADTKFEYGMNYIDGEPIVILIDELCTPDSSRFWDLLELEENKKIVNYDKQIARDYAKMRMQDGNLPNLTKEMIEKLQESYDFILTKTFEAQGMELADARDAKENMRGGKWKL